MKYEKLIEKYGERIFKKVSFFVEDTKVMVNLIEKHKKLIKEVIDDYNYHGSNFGMEYLPAILALAMEKKEKEMEEEVTYY